MSGRPDRGIREFVFGTTRDALPRQLAFWQQLGFRECARGELAAEASEQLYGHRAAVTGCRLAHAGCETHGTGHVRLQAWERLRNEGLGTRPPITTGGRWMGLYTQDILQLRDSFLGEAARGGAFWISPLVAAPLAKPAPAVSLEAPFVGLRETLVFSEDYRLAFIQRGGFDRPGFGTFDLTLPFSNTEGSHANIIQPPRSFDSAFYKTAFGFETAPFGEQHRSGDDPATAAALDLAAGECFEVERIRAPGVPSGLLQLYSSERDSEDCRDLSRAGSRGLCLYAVGSADPGALRETVLEAGAPLAGPVAEDEFGDPAFTFDAPDGYQWLVSAQPS
ncbi:hypothetical protein [Pseudohaliea sp.]|uniref:hypothetical protein n=1 Tax=Pseudohaliea sp. TaxID=2740289 RepID=UPI0032EEDC7B